jgi:hypothetical protein
VLISGEAGIGKSALVATLRTHVRREELTRVAIRCSPYHTNSALYPVIAHVQQAVRLARDDTAEEKRTKLERALQPFSLPLHEVVPLMAALLAVPLPDGRYPPLQMTSLQQRQQTYDALVAWMLEEAERQPVLMVWEDLHWGDPSTLELLTALPDTPQRIQHDLDLLTTLGPALMATQGYAVPEVLQAYTRARELCQQIGETPEHFLILYNLWIFYVIRAEHQTTLELGEQCFQLAQRVQDATLLLMAHFVLGASWFYRGTPPWPVHTWST